MSARHNSLTWAACELGGTDSLARLKSFGTDIAFTTVNGAGGADDFEYNVEAKRKVSFSAKIINLESGGEPATGLSVTVFTVAGDNYLGDLISGSIAVSNPSSDGSGCADYTEYANPQAGRSVAFSAELKVASSIKLHPIITDAISDTLADHEVQVVFTIGDQATSFPMTMKKVGSSESYGEDATVSVEFGIKGEPTLTGAGLLAAALGSASLTLYHDSGFGKWATEALPINCHISSMNLSWSNGQLSESDIQLEAKGKPAYATS